MGVKSEVDFSGWATKAGLKCSDGRTIVAHAFKDQDGARVPLVWQHGHTDPENVLGHAILENRNEGVYAYCFFNSTPKAEHARESVEHGDVSSLSIWANKLVERGGQVFHGAIRELSLVLSGANPGAVIESVNIRHGDGDLYEAEDEAVIFTGLPLEHTNLKHEEKETDMGEKTVQDVYDSMTEEQKNVVHFMVGAALEEAGDMKQGDIDADLDEDDIPGIVATMTDKQRDVLHTLVSEALEENSNDEGKNETGDGKEGNEMKHNVFESGSEGGSASVISHDDMKAIVADATRSGSLKAAVENYALAHGIDNIDTLFPDAKMVGDVPQLDSRRMEWVSTFMGATVKRPFARIRTHAADITADEARAKGYVKGTLKKEEFFSVSRRVTTPTTVYKKQKLDRDDVVDITDFDVVAFLRAEMRLMLDEEIARAALLGDGRDIAHEDKINEQNIRPIASDHELFTTTVNVNILDGSSSITELIDAAVANRRFYKGSGQPMFFTSETVIGQFLTKRDSLGHRIYPTLADVAAELRVSQVVPVEVLEEYDDILGIMVNPADYSFGTDKGGEVNLFDDFDIDYNQYKYLIETRCSGALTRIKAAIVFRSVASNVTLVQPEEPGFDAVTGVVTIPTVAGVTYKNVDGDGTISAGDMAALEEGESVSIYAVPSSSSYAFFNDQTDEWTFTMS